MTLVNVINFLKLLPSYEEIERLLHEEPEATYIFCKATKNMDEIRANMEKIEDTETEEASYLIHCLADKLWERIHTGHFSEISLSTRKIYAVANFFKIFYILFESLDKVQIEICSANLDDAMLVGTTQELYPKCDELLTNLMSFFDGLTAKNQTSPLLPVIKANEHVELSCDIKVFDCPSIMDFKINCFDTLQPALLLNTIAHWPALDKWRNLNYLDEVAGNRCVPIEIGSNYTHDEWSQQIVKIRDFLRRQFMQKSNKSSTNKTNDVEYLAQHELFDQIPKLKDDICIPDYCTLGQCGAAVDIKAWLGPKGTISPMHYDPKHNLLCQVFGTKFIILASPEDTPNLYAHETDFLGNTSKIDAENLNFEQFPLTKNVCFYKLHLQRGDCLYLPPKWWHYVRSESASFSVSFWWE